MTFNRKGSWPALIICLCIISTITCAQETLPVKYFDASWREVPDKENAAFYRVAKRRPDSMYSVVDYYISGKQQMVAVCRQIEPRLTTLEPATLYYESGARQQEGQFVEELAAGIHKYYGKDGKLEYEILHNGDVAKYLSYRSPEGTNLLVNGNAIVRNDTPLGDEAYIEFVDSLKVASYIITNRDTVYHLADEVPTYRGGYIEMYKEVQKSMVYPKPARRLGIEGKVFVMIIVDRNGSVKEAKVVKGIYKLCDDEAVSAVNRTKNWIPAKHKGKVVLGAVVLPITFRLN